MSGREGGWKRPLNGTFRLMAPDHPVPKACPAWIYVFDLDASSNTTPSPIKTRRMIGTDAPAISHWALEIAPQAALSNIDAEAGFLAGLSRRLRTFWPELAKTVVVDMPSEAPTNKGGKKRKSARREVPIVKMEQESTYAGPSGDAIGSEKPDEGES